MTRPRQSHIGPMSSRSADLPHFIPERAVFDIPTRITNAASKGAYSQTADWKNSAMRPGCMDAFALPSHGFRGSESP